MVWNEKDQVYQCISCNYRIEAEPEEEQQKKAPHVDMKDVEDAFERAKSILNSNMDRKINVSMKLGGEWAKRFVALQVLMLEGMKMDKAQFLAGILKNGIHAMFNVFGNMAASREYFQKMAEEGILGQDTVDGLLADMQRLQEKSTDEDIHIDEEDE